MTGGGMVTHHDCIDNALRLWLRRAFAWHAWYQLQHSAVNTIQLQMNSYMTMTVTVAGFDVRPGLP